MRPSKPVSPLSLPLVAQGAGNVVSNNSAGGYGIGWLDELSKQEMNDLINQITTQKALFATAAMMPKERPMGSDELLKAIKMRLRSPLDAFFKHWHAYKINDEKVIVLIVNKDDSHVVLEDGWPMFPSDALITKLRLLEK